MSIYRLEDAPELDTPVLVAALEGWVDAGAAGTTAAAQLAEGGGLVATFDTDAIYDYRARRPTLDILDGRPVKLGWPSLELRSARVGERDLLVLTGPEPDYRWRALTSDVMEVAKRLGVVSWVSLGAIPAAVPHTRPVPILATASASGLLPDGIRQGPDGLLRVPSAALSVLELAASTNGIPAVGFFAQVPHYVNATYPAASIALLTAVGRHLGVEPPIGQLATRALERRNLLDAATASDEDTRAHVERLELLADESKLPAGNELIADIERFLREGSDDGGDEGPDGGSRLH
ncbi:MAG TPA: PAC2 family protein [Candidatus Limnocylindria bacterium]|nr:PAC2 family protein [Candidatus Limnocylindria bacterium]